MSLVPHLARYLPSPIMAPSPQIHSTHFGFDKLSCFTLRFSNHVMLMLGLSWHPPIHRVMHDLHSNMFFLTARSHSKVTLLKEQLTSITKGSSSIASYLQFIRSISDELALIGHPINALDLVMHTLNGLGPTIHQCTTSIGTLALISKTLSAQWPSHKWTWIMLFSMAW